MVFGRRRRDRDEAAEVDAVAEGAADAPDELGAGGPWDDTEVDADPADEPDPGVLDLGSVRVPLPAGGQIQVEMDPAGAVRSVHVAAGGGRITIAAFAAPRSPGQWREVAGELAAQLRTDGAQVQVLDGPWGREVLGVTGATSLRFLGVDGPRWMVRCVVTATPGTDEELSAVARDVLAGTVVVRGTDPLPVRTPLPVVLPAPLLAQLQAAQAQALAQQQAQAQAQAQAQQTRDAADQQPVAPQPPGGGSAMDQVDGGPR